MVVLLVSGLHAELERSLVQAKEALAEATKQKSVMEAGILEAAELLTTVSKNTAAVKAKDSNRSDQLNPNNSNFKPPKR